MSQLLLIRVDIVDRGTDRDLIVPDLTEALAALELVALVVPAVGVEADAELELVVTTNSGGHVGLVEDLLAIEPELDPARVVVGPVSLDNDLVPLAGLELADVVEGRDVAVAVVAAVDAVDDARVEVVAIDPDHGAGHPVVAAVVAARAVRDELRQVVALAGEIPRVRQTDHEAVRARVAALVTVVVVYLRVVAVVVVWVKRLSDLDGRVALVDNIGDLVHGALVLLADVVPAVERA